VVQNLKQAYILIPSFESAKWSVDVHLEVIVHKGEVENKEVYWWLRLQTRENYLERGGLNKLVLCVWGDAVFLSEFSEDFVLRVTEVSLVSSIKSSCTT
jgi:hypothetical protein